MCAAAAMLAVLLLHGSVAVAENTGRRLPSALLINLPRNPDRFNSVKVQLDDANVQFRQWL